MDTYTEMTKYLDLTEKEIAEMRQAGYNAATRERDYQTALARKELALYESGKLPPSLIKQQARGSSEVSSYKFALDCANVNYETSKEAVLMFKKRADALKTMFEREWSQLKNQ